MAVAALFERRCTVRRRAAWCQDQDQACAATQGVGGPSLANATSAIRTLPTIACAFTFTSARVAATSTVEADFTGHAATLASPLAVSVATTASAAFKPGTHT